MTPYQQAAAVDPDSTGDHVWFATEEDYLEWLTKRS